MDPLTPDEQLTLRPGQWSYVEIVAADGRTMFEIVRGKDGRSIEVRAVETCKVYGVLYAGRLEVRPVASNVVRISTVPYEAT